MARASVLAAGGIVLRQARPPLIAVVRLRKGNEWVLPKGKLDEGETPREAAIREVWEETGHDVSVHEFLGTLAYDAGGRSKIVHYWRMETQGRPSRELMGDVRAVDWLPLEAAVERLSRDHERAFLANVGPFALQAAALARRSQETKAPVPIKRRRRRTAAPKPAAVFPPVAPFSNGVAAAGEGDLIERTAVEPVLPHAERQTIETASARSTARGTDSPDEPSSSNAIFPDVMCASEDQTRFRASQDLRVGVMQRVRRWLRRAV